MSRVITMCRVQSATRPAWGPLYVAYTDDEGWAVFDTRALCGKGCLASDMPFQAAVK